MSNHSFLITDNSLTFQYNNEVFTVLKSDSKYDKCLELLRGKEFEELYNLVNIKESVSTYSNGVIRVVGNVVKIKNGDNEFDAPTRLSSMIIQFITEKLPFDSLVNFAVKLSQNPSYRSVNQLFDFIEHNKITICEDGDFIAYKGVRSDFKDCHTGTFDNSVGQVLKMDRNQVNDDPNQTCQAGFHAAAHWYVSDHYGNETTQKIVIVKINPKNVVSIPIDYQNAKMRVCEYEVIDLCKEEIKRPIYETWEDNTDYDPYDDSWNNEDESWDTDEDSNECSEDDTHDIGDLYR
jgi:hypothetical protein